MDIDINPSDLRIDTFDVNPSGWKTDMTGVRIVHIPSGISAQSRLYKSAHRNKATAMEGIRQELIKNGVLTLLPPPTTLDMTLKAHQELEQLLIKRELDLADKFNYLLDGMKKINDILQGSLTTEKVRMMERITSLRLDDAKRYKPLGEETDES
jgi:hypothetical protein